MRRKKLSDKLALLYATLFCAVFFLLSAGVLLCTYQTLFHNKSEYLRNTMPIVKDHILEELAEGDPLAAPGLLTEQAFDLNLNMILYSPQGAVLNQVHNFHMDEAEFPRDSDQVHIIFTRRDGVLLSCRSVLSEGDRQLGSVLLVSNPINEVGYIKLLGVLLLGANVIGVVAAAFVGRYISRRMLSPIDTMIREAGRIDSRHLKRRLPEPEPDDELRRLALTLNGMLDLVEDAFERQSRFTADASHELRTPLAVIRGYADLLRRWGKEDRGVLEEGIEAISRQTEYMQKLVENLLFLARGESDKLDVSKNAFDARTLLEELVREQSALDNGHRYLLGAGPEVRLFGDRAMIRQLLLALIDNSKKFTPQDGSITLSVAQTRDGTVLTVADTGIGMEPAHLAHIFERFYRADKARSRADGGAGLGLAIASAIAQVHGGRIAAKSAPGEGTSIFVTFPYPRDAAESR